MNVCSVIFIVEKNMKNFQLKVKNSFFYEPAVAKTRQDQWMCLSDKFEFNSKVEIFKLNFSK